MRVALLLMTILIAANAISRPTATDALLADDLIIDLQLNTPAPADPASLQKLAEFAGKSVATGRAPAVFRADSNLLRRNDI